MDGSQLPFRISTGLKNIIGRDLITDDYVAVFELVKNSFDAYAQKVVITFKPDKIIIKDDGKGMDIEDIKNKWLFVAYSAKKEGVEDKELEEKDFESYRDKIQIKKYYAGAKGIGRFSCDRLGSELILTTKSASENSKLEQIEVNWNAFEVDSSQDFLDINVKHTTIKPFTREHKQLQHGTILEISKLGSNWTREKKVGLKKSLEKLINPVNDFEDKNTLSTDRNFRIIIEDESELETDKTAKHPREKVNGEVKNFVFETLNIKTTQILTEIDESGKSIIISILDRGTLIYKIKKPNTTNPKLSNIRFNLFYLNRSAKVNFTKLMGIQPAYFGSISLYKNGFRVAPYGDFNDDSFGLNTRQAQKFFERFGTRDVIGRIEIIGENPHFRETSNRNGGLVKNEYYDALVKCFQEYCLGKLESYVKKVSWKTKEDSLKSDLSALENITSKSALLKLIAEEVNDENTKLEDIDKDFVNLRTKELIQQANEEDLRNLNKIAKEFGDKEFSTSTKETGKEHKKIKELEKKLEEEEKARLLAEEESRILADQLEIERQKNTYLNATRRKLDDDANGLIHGIKINAVLINETVEDLIREINNGNLSSKYILKELSNIRFFSDRAFKLSKIITRANFRSDRDKQTIDITKYIIQYLSLYADIYEKSRLSFEVIDNNSSFYKKVSVLDLSVILDNLISNSEKWKSKKILVEMSNLDDGKLEMIFSDDGEGLLKKYLDNPKQIFELGVTETNGSGIGLYTVKDRLKKMKADISFIGNGNRLKGATFQIVFN